MANPVTLTSDARAERKRQRILQAAGDRFAALGYAKSTVEEIARAAGVSKGLVYVHFAGKEELLDAVLEQTLAEWRQVTLSEVERTANGVCAALRVTHRASIDYARSNPVLRTILAGDERVLLTRNDEATRRAMQEWRDGLIELLEAGVASGELDPELDVERVCDVFRLLHLSFLDRLFVSGSIDVTDDRLIDASIDALLYGITAARSRGRR